MTGSTETCNAVSAKSGGEPASPRSTPRIVIWPEPKKLASPRMSSVPRMLSMLASTPGKDASSENRAKVAGVSTSDQIDAKLRLTVPSSGRVRTVGVKAGWSFTGGRWVIEEPGRELPTLASYAPSAESVPAPAEPSAWELGLSADARQRLRRSLERLRGEP